MSAQPVGASKLAEYVKIVGDYAEQVAKAESLKDQDTIAVAEITYAMFEDKAEWVELGLELVPLPKHGKSNWGQKPDTMARFHKVTNALLHQAGRAHDIKSLSTTESTINAGRALSYIPKSEASVFTRMDQVRGLRILVTSGDVARIPEAVEIARQAARERGARTPTGKDVAKAARLVKHAADKARREGATAGKSDAYRIDPLRQKRIKAELAVIEFFDAVQRSRDQDHARQQLGEFYQFFREEQSSRRAK